MQIAFLVQASPQIGLGHLLRCLALAQAAESIGCRVFFVLDSFSHKAIAKRKDWVGELALVKDYAIETIVHSIAELELMPTDWLVIDGYQFDADWLNSVVNLPIRKVIFDDNHLSQPLAVDAVINLAPNNSIEAKYKLFQRAEHLLLGEGYRPLRQDFIETPHTPFQHRKYLTLCFGGSDPANLTLPVLKHLSDLDFRTPVRVVAGAGYAHKVELESFIYSSRLNIDFVFAAENMASIWQQSKLAISAAGGTQFELAVSQTPAVLAVVADNQVDATNEAAQQGWCQVIDCRQSAEIKAQALATAAQRLWNDESELLKMHESLLGRYDACGAQRIVETLIQ